MQSFTFSVLAALAAQKVAAHATFQQLWVSGVDEGGSCLRTPSSNSPITDVSSTDIRCNVNGATGVSGVCSVASGSTVTVEMHQQPNDRSCSNEALGGAHYGPVLVYMSQVDDATTDDGSGGWFKIFEDTWAATNSGNADSDNWGTKDLNTCCGKMNVLIPDDIPSGDYLLRAEAIALHVASSTGGAQFYISCYQISVTNGGSASPSTVSFPGEYSASDPGILFNLYTSQSTYIAPGPTVYSAGSTKSAGAACSGAETSVATSGASTLTTSTSVAVAAVTTGTTAATATTATATSSTSSSCTAAKYEQCGGTDFTGCTTCVSGTTCSAISAPYYYQCT